LLTLKAMRSNLPKWTVMIPSYHPNVAGNERNVSPTLERSSKQSSKGRFSYFRTARDRNLADSHTEKDREFQDCEAYESGSDSEYLRKRRDSGYDEEDRSNLQKVQKPSTVKLSNIQKSNFRIRLYYQLNVLKRVNEKSLYRWSLPKWERPNLGIYCPVTRLKEKHHFLAEISKPIAINSRRIRDFDFENSHIELREVKTSQFDKVSDNEDIFRLDIEPAPMS